MTLGPLSSNDEREIQPAVLPGDGTGVAVKMESDAHISQDARDAHIAVLRSQVAGLKESLRLVETLVFDQIRGQKEAVAIALEAQKNNISIAQKVAEKAMEKAEAAADKRHLEALIDGLKDNFSQQIVSTRDALAAALAAAEKAIQKAEEASAKRFDSVNEFRAQLGDQQKLFATKSECDLRFSGADKQFDSLNEWRRLVEVKFGQHLTTDNFNATLSEWTTWRRGVDASLVAAQSKSTMIWAVCGMLIGAGALLMTILNFFTKAPAAYLAPKTGAVGETGRIGWWLLNAIGLA